MPSELGAALAESFSKTNAVTWAATISAVIYVLLAIKENVWCWSFGIISSGLSVGVYFSESLWYESLLNVFYVVLGIYGWIVWSKTKEERGSAVIKKIPARELLIVTSLAVVIGIALGFFSDSYMKSLLLNAGLSLSANENTFSYTDALLTTFAIAATWMTARKYIENWIFWIVIDACSAVLYYFKGPSMYLFALLFIFYTFMAVAGYHTWRKSLKP